MLKESFEEYHLAPARNTVTDAGVLDNGHEWSVMIWGAAKTDIAVYKMAPSCCRSLCSVLDGWELRFEGS